MLNGLTLRAQPLDQLLEQAQANYPELNAYRYQHDAVLKKADQFNLWPETHVGLGVGVLPAETRLGAQRVKVSASQMLPNRKMIHAKEDAVLVSANVFNEKATAKWLEVRFQIQQAYYQLYEIDQLQEILKDHIKILDALESISLSKVEAGKANLSDVLRVQLKVNAVENEMNLLDNEKKIYYAQINRYTGDSILTEITVQDTLSIATLDFDRQAYTNMIRNHHPDIKALEWKKEASKKQQHVSSFENRATIGFGIDYVNIWERTDADPDHNGRDVIMPKMMLKLPLSKEHINAKIEEERLWQAALDKQQETILDKHLEQIEQAYIVYNDQFIKTEFLLQQIKTTQSTIDILLSAYSGTGNGMDEIIQLESNLLKYKQERVKAIVKSHIQAVLVQKYIDL